MKILFTACLVLPISIFGQIPGLKLTMVNDKPTKVVASYEGYDTGSGNTSLAFDSYDIHKWSGASSYRAESWGYFDATGKEIPYIKRDRDLGQTFKYSSEKASKLKSITVRTGFGTNVVRSGMYGKNVSLQIFEVTGEPVLNNNGSDSTTKAFHGYPHNRYDLNISHERDDYFTGEKYKSITVFTGAVFPTKSDFGFSSDSIIPPSHPKLKGRFLQFSLPQNHKVILKPGRKYAFLLMIDSIGEERGFTLANNYYGKYEDGHGIRRDGAGVFPPVPCNPVLDFTHPENKKALEAAHFPTDMLKRCAISPGTNGYPDVDTWRDIVFYIETE